MKCPKCKSLQGRVTDSRTLQSGTITRRRRECKKCEHRYSTYEKIENRLIIIKEGEKNTLKKETIQEEINCSVGNQLSKKKIQKLAKEIQEELSNEFYREVPFEALFSKIAEKLHQIDNIAFIRYFAYNKNIGNLEEFYKEAKEFLKKSKQTENQKQLL